MHDSRKTLLNVLIDNLVNVFNLATVILLVIFVLNGSIMYAIPLGISICVSVFGLVLDLKHFVLTPGIKQRLNIIMLADCSKTGISPIH